MDPNSNLEGIPNSMVDIPNYYSGIMDFLMDNLDWEGTLSY